MEKLLFQPTYESEFAPQSAEFTDKKEIIGGFRIYEGSLFADKPAL